MTFGEVAPLASSRSDTQPVTFEAWREDVVEVDVAVLVAAVARVIHGDETFDRSTLGRWLRVLGDLLSDLGIGHSLLRVSVTRLSRRRACTRFRAAQGGERPFPARTTLAPAT